MMHRFYRGACLLMLGTALAAADDVSAEQTDVVFKLASGRTFVAQVDARTDDDQLWLRFGGRSAAVLRPVDWDQLITATVGGRRLSRQALIERGGAAMPERERRDESAPAAVTGGEGAPGVEAAGLSDAHRAAMLLDSAPPIAALEAEAHMTQLSPHPDPDGLVVRLYPRDERGAVVPVDGTLSAELLVARRRATQDAPRSRGRVLERAERWTSAVAASAAGPEGVVVRLPLRRLTPQVDPSVGYYGQLNLRLSVPGHGVFETRVTPLPLRNPFVLK